MTECSASLIASANSGVGLPSLSSTPTIWATVATPYHSISTCVILFRPLLAATTEAVTIVTALYQGSTTPPKRILPSLCLPSLDPIIISNFGWSNPARVYPTTNVITLSITNCHKLIRSDKNLLRYNLPITGKTQFDPIKSRVKCTFIVRKIYFIFPVDLTEKIFIDAPDKHGSTRSETKGAGPKRIGAVHHKSVNSLRGRGE